MFVSNPSLGLRRSRLMLTVYDEVIVWGAPVHNPEVFEGHQSRLCGAKNQQQIGSLSSSNPLEEPTGGKQPARSA